MESAFLDRGPQLGVSVEAGPTATLAKAAHRLGLGVISFTGYRYEDLRVRTDGLQRLLAETDLLVDGPYLAGSAETTRSLVGSTNQRFIHLTERYADFDPIDHPNRVYVRVGPDGAIELAGFLGSDELREFSSLAGAVRRLRALKRVGVPKDRLPQVGI